MLESVIWRRAVGGRTPPGIRRPSGVAGSPGFAPMPLTPLQKEGPGPVGRPPQRGEPFRRRGGAQRRRIGPLLARLRHLPRTGRGSNPCEQPGCGGLRAGGFTVETLSRENEWEKLCTFRKAKVSRGKESVEIDWAADSAFRFFPIEQDPQFGWRLHLFDLATNKALTLSARTETRDYVDILELAPAVSARCHLLGGLRQGSGVHPAFPAEDDAAICARGPRQAGGNPGPGTRSGHPQKHVDRHQR